MNALLCSTTTRMSIQPSRFDELVAADVMHHSRAVGGVVFTFVVQTDLDVVVPHIDERLVETVGHPDLGTRTPIARVDEKQPQPGLPGRLASRIHQIECGSGTSYSTQPAISAR